MLRWHNVVLSCGTALLAFGEIEAAQPLTGAPTPVPGAIPPSPTPYSASPYASNALSPSYGYAGYSAYSTRGAGPGAGIGPFWAPGGYEPRIGSPYYYHDPYGGQYVMTGDPYYDHFGPGYHRQSLYGHYRFPYYNYRAPWYYPGRAVYNRDTNAPW